MTASRSKFNRSESIIIVIFAYLFCIASGIYSLHLFYDTSALWQIFIADIIATVILFIFSILFSNSSLYDPYWSVIPPFIVFYWIYIIPDGVFLPRQILILFLISLWSIRLTLNWVRGWKGMHQEDWRYEEIASKTGKLYWLVSFLGIHLFPTILVFLGCLPLVVIMPMESGFGIFDIISRNKSL